MARPVPVSGQVEETIVDFASWKRRRLADGHLSEDDGAELLEITERMVRRSSRLIRSIQFVNRILTGKEGMDSVCVRRQWEERQVELIELDAWRRTDGPSAA